MRKRTRALALSGMLTGLSVVLLIIGSFIGGTYAAPLFAGVALMPVGMTMGRKWHALTWIAASLLGFILLTDREEALMFAFLFGWYPIAKPFFDSLPKPWGAVAGYAAMNICAIAIEALVMLVIMPETESALWIVLLLLLANVLFVVYNKLIPKFALIIKYRLLNKLKL